MKIPRLTLLFFLLLFLVLLPYFALALEDPGGGSAGSQGLIPCGTEKYPQGATQMIGGRTVDVSGQVKNPCQTCHLFVLGQNILNFVWNFIAIPIATLALIYAGFLMVIPIGSTDRLTKGRKVLTNTLIGIAIVFFAWLGIDTIIKVLAEPDRLLSGQPANIQGLGPWNKIECNIVPVSIYQPSAPSNPVVPPPLPGFVPAEPNMARALIQNPKITWESTGENCAGFNARNTIDAVAVGQKPPVCSRLCQCRPGGANGNITLSNNMLIALDGAAQQFSFKVTSLTTGRHTSDNSQHYFGRAVDLKQTGNTTYVQLETAMNVAGALLVQCENAAGNTIPCTSSPTSIGHIHAEFR